MLARVHLERQVARSSARAGPTEGELGCPRASVGSVTDSGFYWVNPFFSKRKITLRVRNFETGSTTTPESAGDGMEEA